MSLKELIFGPSAESRAKFPWLFTTNPIDAHTCTRQVPMRVLSLGMGRTGTASMQAALQTLGYPTYHGFEMHANVPDNDMWNEALDAKYKRTPRFQGPEGEVWGEEEWRAHFDRLLGHVSATTDLPCNVFGPELMAAYPEAKVILVEREIESWYASWENALIKSLEIPGLDFYMRFDGDVRKMVNVAREGVMKYQFHAATTQQYRTNARSTYRAHYAEVRALLKDQPGRLLEYRLGSGWEPLCEFLSQPVPNVKFPHVNESAAHDEMGEVAKVMMARRMFGFLFFGVVPVVAAVGAVWWRLR